MQKSKAPSCFRSLLLLVLLLSFLLPALSVNAAESRQETLPPPVFVAPGEEHLMHIQSTADGILYSIKDDQTIRIEGCRTTSLRLVIPAEINGLRVNEIAPAAFMGNDGPVSIEIPDSVQTIGARAFENCVNLTSVTLPDTLRIIPERCFQGSMGLTRVNLPQDLTTIGDQAFYLCVMLGNMKAPASLREIGTDAFLGCEQLILDCSENELAAAYAEEMKIPQNFFQTTNAQLLMLLAVTVILAVAFLLLRKPLFCLLRTALRALRAKRNG